MPVSADTLGILISAGLSGDKLIEAVRAIDADMAAMVPATVARTSNAERQARYRHRKSTETVTSNVTSNVTDERNETVTNVTVDAASSRARVVIPLEVKKEKETELTLCEESSAARLPPKPTALTLTPAFNRFKAAYPARKGSNPWTTALDKFVTAVRNGADPEQIISAAGLYAEECRSAGSLGTSYVAQAVTWLHQRRFADYAAPPPTQELPPPPTPPGKSDAELRAKHARLRNADAGTATEPSGSLQREGGSVHSAPEILPGGRAPSGGNPPRQRGMVRLGEIFQGLPGLDAGRDDDGRQGYHPVDDGPVPMARMVR